MATLKPCLDCGGLHHNGGARCKGCTSDAQRARDAARGNRHQRGLGTDHEALRALVLADDPPCHWCGKPATTADHLQQRADGGSNTLDNYVPACAPCNYGRRPQT